MRKKKKNYYFAEKEEQAILDYINSNSREERDRIYNEILKEPFRKMVQSILRRYPIHIGNYEIEEVEHNALSHLIEQMVKFNPDTITKSGQKTKAFSYCQTIVRNYFKDHSKKTYTEKIVNLPYDDYQEEVNENSEYHYELDEMENHSVLDDLINDVTSKIEEMIANNNKLKYNEIIIGEAVINILRNWNVLFLEDSPVGKYDKKVTNKFAKNKILFFLKEQTGLTTKEIRVALKPFKNLYFIEKTKYLDY